MHGLLKSKKRFNEKNAAFARLMSASEHKPKCMILPPADYLVTMASFCGDNQSTSKNAASFQSIFN
jgi:hypothetical protein